MTARTAYLRAGTTRAESYAIEKMTGESPGRAMRVLARRNGRRILFSSDSRAELGGNQKLVYDRMVELGLDREFELLTLFKPGIVARRSIRDRLRLSIRSMKAYLADPAANVAVIDGFERTEELRICRWCNFRVVCRPEL